MLNKTENYLEDSVDADPVMPDVKSLAGVRTMVQSAEIRVNKKGIQCLVITWQRYDLEPLVIRDDDLEGPLFKHALTLLPLDKGPKAVGGVYLDVEVDSNGSPIFLAKEGCEPVSIRQALIDRGYLSE